MTKTKIHKRRSRAKRALNRLQTVHERISDQADEIEVWLKENHPEVVTDQKHLDKGTEARAYWHYGRLIALRDALQALAN